MSTEPGQVRARSSSPEAERMRLYRNRRREAMRYVRIPLHVTEVDALIRREVASAQVSTAIRAKYASWTCVAALERLARSDRRHAATVEIWDADPWSLNTPGGLANLRIGAIVPHKRDHYNTKITAATPRGACPAWLSF